MASADSPVLYNAYGARQEHKYTALQDVMFVFSKNTEVARRNEPTPDKNDLIGVSCINVPHRGFTIPKDFHNFYNCVGYERVSYFCQNKSLIVCSEGPPVPAAGPPGQRLPRRALFRRHPKHPRQVHLYLGPVPQAQREGTPRG